MNLVLSWSVRLGRLRAWPRMALSIYLREDGPESGTVLVCEARWTEGLAKDDPVHLPERGWP